jgi:hypothetical protein
MVKLPSPTDWLSCREAYQLAKYLLRKDEHALKTALDIWNDWEIERALLTPTCIIGFHKKVADNYKQSSREFDEASKNFELACQIQAEAKKLKDTNIPAIIKSK